MSGHIITIAQQKGGSGKTTLAANLAVAFLAAGKRVAIVDTDPQGSLGKWFMQRLDRAGEDAALRFATASAWGISYELRNMRKDADIVIVDTPPKADSDLRPALREADLVLVPLSVSHLDVWATQDVLDLATREGRPARIVMNRVRSGTRLSTDIAAEAAKFDTAILDATLANRVIFAEAFGTGRGVIEAQPKGAAAREIAALHAEVAALL